VLLSAAGLLTGALRNLEHQNLGFEQDGRTVIHIDPVLAGCKPERLELLYRRIHDSFANIAGVTSIACAQYTPLSGDSWSEPISVEGKPEFGRNAETEAWWARVVPGFFEVIGNRIVRGRPIDERDTAGSQHVAVINEAFARKFFKNQDPLGKHFGKGGMEYANDYEIVGVARVANTFSQQRLIARLTSLFGILALVLASIGIYGMTAYNVGSRTNEIGVRVALGADRRDILTLILRGSFLLIAFGLLLGLPLALGAARFLGSQLYGLNQYDPLVLSAAGLTLALAALVAAFIPAYRGSSISPMQALRAE
jgi:FtsX-like permease family protein/MacB-like protein